MRAEEQGDRIDGVLGGCRAYWMNGGISRGRADEMAEELDLHLREALENGKDVEDVVGPDIKAFAEEWAAPNRQAKPLSAETLDVLSDAAAGLSVLAVLAHLTLWTPSLPVDWKSVLGAIIWALILARFFAYLRPPADAPPGSDEKVVDRYPRRLYSSLMWLLIAVFAVYTFLPLPETVLFRWPLSATLALPAVAVLLRAAQRLLPRVQTGEGGPSRRNASRMPADDREKQVVEALLACRWQWMKMRMPQDGIEEMSELLEQHIEDATRDGKPVEAVVGPDVAAFAEAWAQDSGIEPESAEEPLRHRVQGWVLSVSSFATISATFVHLMEWTLFVPVAWILGTYLFILSIWFFGERIDEQVQSAKRWRYTPWKSLLAASIVVLAMVGVSVVLALFFMVVGPMFPFDWPWYATVASALIAFLVLFGWVREFDRSHLENQK